MAGFPIGGFGMQGSHDSVMNSQSGLGLDVCIVIKIFTL